MLAAGVHVQLEVLQAGRVEGGHDLHPLVGGHVRVPGTEDHHQPALHVAGAGERSGIGVGAQCTVVQPGRIEAHRRIHPRVERCPKRQVATDAEPRREQLLDVCALLQEVQHRGPVGIELLRGGLGGARQTGLLADVVELQRDTGQRTTRVDLRHAHHEASRGEPARRPQRRLGQLENVGVQQHARPPALTDRPDHHRPNLAVRRRHPHVVLAQLHAAPPYWCEAPV